MMADKNYTPKHGAVETFDAIGIDHKSPEYKLGLAQLAEWHARCRAKRLGIERKAKSVHSCSAARHNNFGGSK